MSSLFSFINEKHSKKTKTLKTPNTVKKNIQTKVIDSLFASTIAIEHYINYLEEAGIDESIIKQLDGDKAKLKEITKNILQIEKKIGGTKKNQKRQRKTRKTR